MGAIMGVTDWVRKALDELGPNAGLKEVGDYIIARDATVPRSYISLALLKLKKRNLSSEREKPPPRPAQ
jgi:hypothetical protein